MPIHFIFVIREVVMLSRHRTWADVAARYQEYIKLIASVCDLVEGG